MYTMTKMTDPEFRDQITQQTIHPMDTVEGWTDLKGILIETTVGMQPEEDRVEISLMMLGINLVEGE